MKFLRFVIAAVLVSACAFHVRAEETESSQGWLSSAASAVRNVGSGTLQGLSNTGHLITNGANATSHLIVRGANSTGHLLANGASAGSGMVLNGAGAVGHGIRSGSRYIGRRASAALARVTPKALMSAMNITGLMGNLDISHVLARVLTGQAGNGMDYHVAAAVLERVAWFVPPLDNAVKALRLSSYVMKKLRLAVQEGRRPDAREMMGQALARIFPDADEKFRENLMNIAPLLLRLLREGNKEQTAMEIVKSLVNRQTIEAVMTTMVGTGPTRLFQFTRNIVGDVYRMARRSDRRSQIDNHIENIDQREVRSSVHVGRTDANVGRHEVRSAVHVNVNNLEAQPVANAETVEAVTSINNSAVDAVRQNQANKVSTESITVSTVEA